MATGTVFVHHSAIVGEAARRSQMERAGDKRSRKE